MNVEHWDDLSTWLNAWLTADPATRERLRSTLASEHPQLVAEAETLIEAATRLHGFLDTPAIMIAAHEIAADDGLLSQGELVGPYRIVTLIARGGMGDVYRATDERLKRDIALKVLATTTTGEPRRVDRFMQEARITAALDHPNIVRVYDVGRVDDRAYLVAELLEGQTLRSRIANGPLPVEDTVRIACDVARGLVAAHAAGLVHRDLKPDNIFLTASGTTKILDFGIAKLAQDEAVPDGLSTLTGVVLGTAGYLAPEQIRGEAIDARADLFAMGTLLFEMLTGTRAFGRDHLVETLHAILHDSPSDALLFSRRDVPAPLITIVLRLLQKTPEQRFQSAADVIAALESAGVTPPASRQLARHVMLTKRYLTRRRWPTAALIGLLSLAAAGAVAFYAPWKPTGPVAATATPLTIAVMPFRSIPASGDSDLIDLGFADALIIRLSRLNGVRVLPLTATERVRDQEPAAVARKLGADRVLAVTLQRANGGVRATPKLWSASNETVWATTIDADAATLFSIQDIIVTQLIEELAPKLGSAAKSRLAKTGTHNNEAFEAYARGRAYVLNPTRRALTQAKESFEQAVKLDPTYADAWAGLGSAYKRMPIAAGIPGRNAFPEARRAAARALELDPEHAEAVSVLGTVAFWYEWDYPKAERLLRRALELQPSSADSQLFLAHLLANTGRFDEALAEIRRARAFDPEWPLPHAHEGHFLFMARRYKDALEHLNATVKLAPRFWPGQQMRLLPLLALGRYEDAIRQSDTSIQVRRSVNSSEDSTPFFKGYALARLGRRADAERILEDIRRSTRDVLDGEALILHGLQRDEEAFQRLQEAINARDFSVTFLGVYPWWDDVRDVPAFRTLLSQVHLLEVSDGMRSRMNR